MGKKASIEDIEKRFWAKVEKGDECWLWTGLLSPGGHGVTSYKGKSIGAHRLSWIIYNGEIPTDEHGYTFRKIICHTCDNKNCVNPDHLYLGDHQSNATDRVRSGKYRGSRYNDRYKREFGPLSATVFFDDDRKEDVELIEWLRTLPHGYFSDEAKRHFRERMNHHNDPRVGFNKKPEKMRG